MEKISCDGMSITSEVVDVFPGYMADRIGVEIGCIVVAINSEQYISHSHTVATLKHSKRPITVKFLYPHPMEASALENKIACSCKENAS